MSKFLDVATSPNVFDSLESLCFNYYPLNDAHYRLISVLTRIKGEMGGLFFKGYDSLSEVHKYTFYKLKENILDLLKLEYLKEFKFDNFTMIHSPKLEKNRLIFKGGNGFFQSRFNIYSLVPSRLVNGHFIDRTSTIILQMEELSLFSTYLHHLSSYLIKIKECFLMTTEMQLIPFEKWASSCEWDIFFDLTNETEIFLLPLDVEVVASIVSQRIDSDMNDISGDKFLDYYKMDFIIFNEARYHLIKIYLKFD